MKIFEIRKEYNKELNEYMVIELNYNIGGYNYFYNKTEPRRYEILFTIMGISDGFRKFTPMDDRNFKLVVKEVKRKSKKLERKIIDEIENHKDELFEAFEVDDKQKCVVIVNSFNV